MDNSKIILIFDRYISRLSEGYSCLSVDDSDREQILELDSSIDDDENIMACKINKDNETYFALTDKWIYTDTNTISLESLASVKVRNNNIKFIDKDGEYVSIDVRDVCDENLIDNSFDFKLFIKMLNEMVKASQKEESDRHSADISTRKTSSRQKESTIHNAETPQHKEKNTIFDDSHNNTVITEKNLGEIFSAGKDMDNSSAVDMRVSAELKDKEKDLKNLRKQHTLLINLIEKLKTEEKQYPPSQIGDTNKISSLKDNLSKGLKELETLKNQLNTAKKDWENNAYPLFIAATRANSRIIIGFKGFKISPASDATDSLPGVYTTTSAVSDANSLEHLPTDVATDMVSKAQALSDKWIRYLNINTEVWKKIAALSGNKPAIPNSTIESAVKAEQDKLDSAYSQAKRHEEWTKRVDSEKEREEKNRKDIGSLEQEVVKLRHKKEDMMRKLTEIDPILTAFHLPKGKNVYDQEWIDNVKKAASERKAIPYLPLQWNGQASGSVFNWQNAIEEGKPNLFIEAATDEGDYGRIDMLDNFVATMLLAFPVKSLRFTVIEQNRASTFVTQLPTKVCEIYNVDSHSESIQMVADRLNEILRGNRSSNGSGLPPREIIVFVGFRKKEKKLVEVMEKFREPIEKGRLAGIYFAIVLDEDITKYNWGSEDANRFVQFFTPYSTILTERTDKDGNPIPAYGLLKSMAEYQTEDGDKKGSLADLITHYLDVESSTVPNKVYELIQNGKMYTDSLITNLDQQPRKDAGKLVVPIADDGNGGVIDMVMDDQEYMFYFILGMTGSGKSFTLHTILSNLMLKYDPSVVDIVIMDFKGGIEMADYRDVPHVSSILANGADVQVAGEMLMSLQKEMKLRDQLFTKSGTKSISEYNRYAIRTGKEQMKSIIFVVDECQDLFRIDRPINSSEFIAMLAKKGRIYGIHMILATQTLKNSGIPRDALSQFSDFIFMKCAPDDVTTCGITNKDLQQQVATLSKGEMYYCHNQSEPIHGYVYNYAGKGNVYKDKTLENLKGRRFRKPEKKQFYFDSQQVFSLDLPEIREVVSKAKSGLKKIPTAVLGKNLSVNLDTIYVKFGKTDGANLLIVGTNDRLQGERVLWNAVMSLCRCNKLIGQTARYYILPNIPEEMDADAVDIHEKRLHMLRSLCSESEVTMAEDDERADTIERVAATVRGRVQLAETDKQAMDALDTIYLIIPNQQMFAKNMARHPKGLESLDSGLNLKTVEPSYAHTSESSSDSDQDNLGFEGLEMPASVTATPGFDAIDFGSLDHKPQLQTSSSLHAGTPGRDYDEELRYILEYGPSVNVHVLLQTTAPDKIYSGDTMREKEMGLLFNDIVFLKMLQASTMSLPVDSRLIEKLSAEPASLRAIAYNGEREPRTIVPFDFK